MGIIVNKEVAFMEERIIKNGKVKILPGNELPYVGQVVEFENEYYSIIRLSKIEWVDTAIRVNFVMERVEEIQLWLQIKN